MTENEITDLILSGDYANLVKVQSDCRPLSANNERALCLTILDLKEKSEQQVQEKTTLLEYFILNFKVNAAIFQDFIVKERLPRDWWPLFIQSNEYTLEPSQIDVIISKILLHSKNTIAAQQQIYRRSPDTANIISQIYQSGLITTTPQLTTFLKNFHRYKFIAIHASTYYRESHKFLDGLNYEQLQILIKSQKNSKNNIVHDCDMARALPAFPKLNSLELARIYTNSNIDQQPNCFTFQNLIAKAWYLRQDSITLMKSLRVNFIGLDNKSSENAAFTQKLMKLQIKKSQLHLTIP